MKAKKTTKRLNLDDRKKIQSYIADGFSVTRIAELMNCAKSTIYYEFRIYGGKRKYNANSAHEGRFRAVHFNFEMAIQPIQMQIDILFEELNKLKGEKQ